MKDYTITVRRRDTGRQHTWHTNKPPVTAELMRDNWFVNVSYNRPIVLSASGLKALGREGT